MQAHIVDILSVMNDHLIDGKTTSAPPRPLDGIMKMLNEMIGRNNYTTDLTRAYQTCAPFLRRQFPHLDGVVCRDMSLDGRREWLTQQASQFGEYLEVAPIPEVELRHDWDSMQEAIDLAGDKIIGISPDQLDDFLGKQR